MYLGGINLAKVCRPPLKSLLRFNSVCKRWSSLTSEPHFLEQKTRAHNQSHRIVLLECPKRYNDLLSVYMVNEEAGNRICSKLNANLSSDGWNYYYRIVGSCNGLLCLAPRTVDAFAPIWLLNPTTNEWKKLPVPDIDNPDDTRTCYSFGFDPITKNYKVICTYREYFWDTEYYEESLTDDDIATRGAILTVGESSWRDLKLPYNVQYDFDMALLDGVLYWMIDNDDKRYCGSEGLLALNINDEKFHTINYPSIGSDSSSRLVNLGGTLTVVEDDELNTSFRIWQRDCSNGWIRQHTCRLSHETYNKYYLTLFGVNYHDGVKFLFQATEKGQMYEPQSHLGIYNLQEQNYTILAIANIPRDFDPHFLAPSNTSLSEVFGSRGESSTRKKQKEDQRCKTGRANKQLDGHKPSLQIVAKNSEVAGRVFGLGLAVAT